MIDNQTLNQCDSVLDLDDLRVDTLTTQMVRMIQQSRSEEPCFATDKRFDCAESCEWRKDCRKLMATWLRR